MPKYTKPFKLNGKIYIYKMKILSFLKMKEALSLHTERA